MIQLEVGIKFALCFELYLELKIDTVETWKRIGNWGETASPTNWYSFLEYCTIPVNDYLKIQPNTIEKCASVVGFM